MVIYQKRIYRDDLRCNPTVTYLFGDNERRVGLGGQAGEMRGEPNAVGVRTKRLPSNALDAFWSDDNFTDNCRKVFEDLVPVFALLSKDASRIVVVPTDGLGTGLSALQIHAPRTLAYVDQLINNLY